MDPSSFLPDLQVALCLAAVVVVVVVRVAAVDVSASRDLAADAEGTA